MGTDDLVGYGLYGGGLEGVGLEGGGLSGGGLDHGGLDGGGPDCGGLDGALQGYLYSVKIISLSPPFPAPYLSPKAWDTNFSNKYGENY